MGRGLVSILVILVSLPAAAALSASLPTTGIDAPLPSSGITGSAPLATPATRDDADYRLVFHCPDVVPGTGVPAACPTYVLDQEDVMGSPLLAVDPANPDLIAFGALHGGRGVRSVPGTEPPSATSRDDDVHQPHTVFATRDGGRAWVDMPYHAPDPLQAPGREIFGDDHAITLDGEGRLIIAAAYTYREAGGPFSPPGALSSAVAVWKAREISKPVDYHVNMKLLTPTSDPAARIQSVHLAYVAQTDVLALVWLETSADGAPAGVTLHWSRGSDGALWNDAKLDLPGCQAISNPIALADALVIACADETGAWRAHGIDTKTWAVTPLGEAPISTARALLVDRGHGYLVLLGSGITSNNTPSVQVSYGEGGSRWSGAEEISTDLTRGDPGAIMVDARITAAAYNPVSGNLHIIYLERYDLGQGGEQGAGRPEFYKTLASLQAEGTFQAKIDLGIGTANRAAFSPTLTGIGGDVYADIHDSLVIWTDPVRGTIREFVAFGDYGFVRYAELTEENFLSPIAPLSAQVPPVPAASAGAVPALVAVPAGILAGSMVARSLMARKKATAEAPSE